MVDSNHGCHFRLNVGPLKLLLPCRVRSELAPPRSLPCDAADASTNGPGHPESWKKVFTHTQVSHIFIYLIPIYIIYIYIYRERAQTMPKSSEISKMDQFLLGFSLFANLSRGLLSFGLRHHRGPETPGWWIGGFHRKDPKRMISCYQSLLKIWAWHSLVVLYS